MTTEICLTVCTFLVIPTTSINQTNGTLVRGKACYMKITHYSVFAVMAY